ncbi:hypothetical protein [Paracidovorax konjaci]|uniref:Uncharacterized protein n=1 Tax=Paracidovorax konjaci TaxID=32040 RepID=A0A1I1VV95_9BURK|nr:hypothetical protein [Paracidovorax konjaci]SFD86794.1 hypothetical protein SAMN04489710_107208 [Paracidovorax konjaci]
MIHTAGAQPAYGSDADCSGRVIDTARVRHFWNRAQEGTADEYRRGLDLQDCEAQAEIHFRSESEGRLSLDDATGWGVLEQNGRTRYFFCASCEGILGRGFPARAAK